MKKKLIGLVFAATMLFGASMTVFAVSDNDVTANDITSTGGQDIVFDVAVQSATISVTVTKGDEIIANPYALEVSGVIEADSNGTVPTLTSSTITFQNKGATPVSVGLTGMITPGSSSDVTVATSASKISSATTKMVYIEANVYGDDAGTKLFYKNGSSKAESALVYSAKGKEISNAPVLAAGGKAVAANNESDIIYVILSGATSVSPDSKWDETADAFKVTTTYDIGYSTSSELSSFK